MMFLKNYLKLMSKKSLKTVDVTVEYFSQKNL